MKAAIYARVSRDEQEIRNQLEQLRSYAISRHNLTAVEYLDHETGKHANRPAFQDLFGAASRHEFSLVIVWALDRFTREGVSETFQHIAKLKSYGVEFESYTEPHFRTTGPFGELMIAMSAWIAKQERARISERTKAGLATARRQGKELGRPKRVFDRWQAVVLRNEGLSWSEIATRLKVPASTLRKACASLEGE